MLNGWLAVIRLVQYLMGNKKCHYCEIHLLNIFFIFRKIIAKTNSAATIQILWYSSDFQLYLHTFIFLILVFNVSI